MRKYMNFLSNKLCVNRLVNEFREHNGLIVAYDFDNTVYDYGNRGYNHSKVINLLKECKRMGCTLIVYTCSKEERYPEIIKYLNDNDIPFDYINENSPKITFAAGKIYYNILIDDRCGLSAAYKQLNKCIKIIKKERKGRE